jgi:hypothetical protein
VLRDVRPGEAGEALSLGGLGRFDLECYGLRGCVRWLRPEVEAALLGIGDAVPVLVDEQVDRDHRLLVPDAPGVAVRVPDGLRGCRPGRLGGRGDLVEILIFGLVIVGLDRQ